MASAAEITATTKKYLKNEWENIANVRPTFAMMKKKGNIITGQSGLSLDWTVRVSRYDIDGADDYEDLNDRISRQNHRIRPNRTWAEEVGGDRVSKGEFARQGEETALTNLQMQRIPDLAEDFMDKLDLRLLTSDDPTNNRFDGLESFTAYTAGTEKSNKVSGATLASNDTYLGYSTALDGLAGQVTGNPESDAWTPTLVNTGATWDSGGTGFDSTNAYEILAYGIDQLSFSDKPKYNPDCVVLARDAFNAYKQALVGKQRILTKGEPSEFGLGASVQMVDVDGIPVFRDEYLSDGEGFILNFDQAWMDVLQVPDMVSADNVKGKKGYDKEMFDVECTYEPLVRGIIITVTCRGNFRFNPRYQGKIADFSS